MMTAVMFSRDLVNKQT